MLAGLSAALGLRTAASPSPGAHRRRSEPWRPSWPAGIALRRSTGPCASPLGCGPAVAERARLGSRRVILAIDQGTTGTTCLVFDGEAELVGRAYREFGQHFPRPGWVEHDAARDLGRHARGRRRGARRRRRRRRASCAAVGITNQRETVCVWDPATGEPLHRALVWQDRRTAARCDELRAPGLRAARARPHRARARPVLLGDEDRVAAGERRRPAPSARATAARCSARSTRWLAFKLTGEHVTDPRTPRGRCSTTSRAGALVGGAVRAVRRPRARAAAGAPVDRRVRPPARRRAARPRRRAAGGHRRRPAVRALRPGLPRSRARARTPTARARSCSSTPAATRRRSPPPGLLATVAWSIGQRTTSTRSRPRSSSPAPPCSGCATGSASSSSAARDAGARGLARRQRRRLLRSGADRARLAALGSLRARHDRRADARHRRARTSRARRSRRSPTRPSTRCARSRRRPGQPLAALKADGGATANAWLMQFQADVLGVPVVVPRGRRDDGARRGAARGRRRRRLDAGPRARAVARAARATSRAIGDDERERAARGLGAGARALARLGAARRLSGVDGFGARQTATSETDAAGDRPKRASSRSRSRSTRTRARSRSSSSTTTGR